MKEWLITNGIGGYASSTDYGGMNTRRYHGLLIASTNPPGSRKLILSKLDESISVEDRSYKLYTNDTNGQITEGHEYQVWFEKDILPKYRFKVEDIEVEKTIALIRNKNVVIVYYRVQNGSKSIRMHLTPVVNFRNFHDMKTDTRFTYTQVIEENKIQLVFNQSDKINLGLLGSTYYPHNGDFFRNMHYKKEEERGFYPNENHIVPGTFDFDIQPNEEKTFTFVCSIEGQFGESFENILNIKGEDVIKEEYNRVNALIRQSELLDRVYNPEEQAIYVNLVKKYIVASDNFIVKRASNNLSTIIAGYPWFLDWGRDSLISFEGLLLIPRRFDEAKEVLKTYIDSIKDGLVPNAFIEDEDKAIYNSADGSLLLFDAIFKYLKYTQDYDFIKGDIYKKLRVVIDRYIDGTNLENNEIYVDEQDYLLSTGNENTQNTWMDTRVDGKPVTPRNGKAVELNALWYNALRVMQHICAHFNNILGQAEYSYLARKVKKSYIKNFYNAEKKCLYDVLGDNRVRPNQVFALGLSFPVIGPNTREGKETFITITNDLLTKYGLKTLANYEPGYTPRYEGGPSERDRAYHQGTIWPWLLGPYYDTIKNMIKFEKNRTYQMELHNTLNQFKANIRETFENEITNGNTIGSIAEVYDAEDPKEGKGCFAQAWSVASIFRILFDKETFDFSTNDAQ
jgi:predicted glycogen debranching enzyme